jgi:phage I-like protein
VRPAVKPAKVAVPATASADATRLAADIERGLADGRLDLLSAPALQALMAAACKAYAAQIEAGNPMAALAQRTTVTPTEVMVTASGLLRAANLAVFELGMWQSWTGR